MILETIGTPGLSGLDKLISFYIVIELEGLVHYTEKSIRNKTWTSILEDCEASLSTLDSAKGKTLKKKKNKSHHYQISAMFFCILITDTRIIKNVLLNAIYSLTIKLKVED